jgi:hypothetical protein
VKNPIKPITLAIALLLSGTAFAQGPGPEPKQEATPITPAERAEVLSRLKAELNGYYVYPDQAKKMAAELQAREKSGAYAQVPSAEEFAKTLTKDLRAVSHDGHIAIGFSPRPLPPQAFLDAEEPTPEDLEFDRKHNFGVERVERLRFNIGYFDLRAFVAAPRSEKKLAAAMTLLADTDALIIDLRFNGGGDPATVAMLASYLFDTKTHLSDIYDRPKDKTTQYWTNDAATPKYGGSKKVYILVSHDTFSAAEDFSYALKNLKRATIVGATTGGGAHPGSGRQLTDHFIAMVPSGRSISPITKTDWEGVGVVPDVAIEPEKALNKAQAIYLAEKLAGAKDEELRKDIQKRLAELN